MGGGVTYKRYFDLPRIRQAADERVVLLQSELDNERRQRQEKDALIQDLMNQLAAQKGQLQSMPTPLTPTQVRHFLCCFFFGYKCGIILPNKRL